MLKGQHVMTKKSHTTNPRRARGDVSNVLQIPVGRRAEAVGRDLQRFVGEVLLQVEWYAGADALDGVATRLMVATAAVLRHKRGIDRLHYVLDLIEAVHEEL